MYSKLINNFTESTEYTYHFNINKETNLSVEEFSDLENRLFPVKDCWEFIGFTDGAFLASSQVRHNDKILSMSSEYEYLLNEFLNDQVLRRIDSLLGNKYTQAHHIFSEIEQLSIKANSLGEDYDISIIPTWTILTDSSSEFNSDDNVDILFDLSKSFDNKYKRGFQTGLIEGSEIPSNELESFYSRNEFELPFSAEYILLGAAENY